MSTPAQGRPPRPGFKKTLLTGLLTLLPIWLTWVVVKFVFVLLSDVSAPWVLPLSRRIAASDPRLLGWFADAWVQTTIAMVATVLVIDRKSTRLNSSHVKISYAVFCLKKKR